MNRYLSNTALFFHLMTIIYFSLAGSTVFPKFSPSQL